MTLQLRTRDIESMQIMLLIRCPDCQLRFACLVDGGKRKGGVCLKCQSPFLLPRLPVLHTAEPCAGGYQDDPHHFRLELVARHIATTIDPVGKRHRVPCPWCNKRYEQRWRLVDHLRKSHEPKLVALFNRPADDVELAAKTRTLAHGVRRNAGRKAHRV